MMLPTTFRDYSTSSRMVAVGANESLALSSLTSVSQPVPPNAISKLKLLPRELCTNNKQKDDCSAILSSPSDQGEVRRAGSYKMTKHDKKCKNNLFLLIFTLFCSFSCFLLIFALF